MIPPPSDEPSPSLGDATGNSHNNGNSSVSLPHSAPPATGRTRTAEEEREHADWDALAATAEFRDLVKRKARFIIPATCFFLIYYFALPVLVGWFPEWMNRPIGPINLAYAFALSQFVMAWAIAAVYVKVAAGWDKSAEAIVSKTRKG